MRIRKRFLSLSASFTALPPSDLHHRHHPLLRVQQQQHLHPNGNLRVLYDNTNSQPSDPPPPPPSHHTPQIGLQPSTTDLPALIIIPQKKLESENKDEIIKMDDTERNDSILGAETSSRTTTTTTTGSNLGWFEGDRLIPIKKRRGSFGKRVQHDVEKDEGITRNLIKPIKKNDEEECVATQETISASKKNYKKNGKRGNVIMEGSRCSRVNGRGWRCCQQTLVGYSLCEHHLGKGRLRSMNSVRGRARKVALKEQAAGKEAENNIPLDDEHEFEGDDEDWEEEYSMSCMEKNGKKKKLGVVKARSLSSLLSQIGS